MGTFLKRLVGFQWFDQEAIFGIPIGVSVDFIFLFVLFGAFLKQQEEENIFRFSICYGWKNEHFISFSLFLLLFCSFFMCLFSFKITLAIPL